MGYESFHSIEILADEKIYQKYFSLTYGQELDELALGTQEWFHSTRSFSKFSNLHHQKIVVLKYRRALKLMILSQWKSFLTNLNAGRGKPWAGQINVTALSSSCIILLELNLSGNFGFVLPIGSDNYKNGWNGIKKQLY